MDTASICGRQRDAAIPHDRLKVNTDVPCDPIDAALETFRTDVVFEQEARPQLKEAQRRLIRPETIGAHQHGSDDVRAPWAGPPVSNRSKGIRSADERIRCRGER